ncbi:MAG: hypothetical protein J6Q38_03015, partial [Clostridia bacterium]|nr:hypothetical protein [Clostridia bacterium]
MVLYLGTIIVNTILIIFLNYLLNPPLVDRFGFLGLLGIVIALVLTQIIIDAILATIARWILPEKLVNVDKTYFSSTKKETRFYEKIGIKKWKDKVLELGTTTGFRKNKLLNPSDNTYVKRFIIEANYGIVVHVFCVIFGCSILFFGLYTITIPIT